jgi:hypothetical protein
MVKFPHPWFLAFAWREAQTRGTLRLVLRLFLHRDLRRVAFTGGRWLTFLSLSALPPNLDGAALAAPETRILDSGRFLGNSHSKRDQPTIHDPKIPPAFCI